MSQKIRWNELIPLTESNNDYEPEMDQIVGYAEFIGLQLPADNKYLYIAREGLKSPLPPFWQACEAPDGQLYFRNKKTRVITQDNPLDEIYIQKVTQLKHFQAQTNIFAINEESDLNQSSGIMKSKLRTSDLRKSQKQNILNLSQVNVAFERHITQQSIEVQNTSADKISPKRSEVHLEPEWKTQQRWQIQQLKSRISNMVPSKHELINNIQFSELQNIEGIMNRQNAQKVLQLKVMVENKRAILLKLKEQRKILQKTLTQMRQQK